MKTQAKHLIACLLLFIAIILSCEFQPGEIPDSHIQKPSETPPGITLDITPETDTLWVNAPVVIRFHANATPRNLAMVEFSVDGTVVYERSWDLQGTIEMTLEIAPYSDGLHTLSMTFITNTNSGSIADKTGNEGYMYTLEWPLLINRNPGHTIAIFPVEPVENGVKLHWEAYNHPAFKNYTITKYSDSYYQSKTLAVITDRRTTSFVDNTYLEGEKAYYTIGLNEPYGSGINYAEMPEPPVIDQIGPFIINLSWNKTRNPAMLNYYLLYVEQDYPIPIGNTVVYDADSTSRELNNLCFGKNYKFIFQYIPKEYTGSIPSYGINRAEKTFALGDSMDTHELSRGMPGTDELLLIKGNQVNDFNVKTGKSTPLLDVDFDISWAINVSPDGNQYGYSTQEEFWVRSTASNDVLFKLPYPAFEAYRLVMYTLSSNNRILAGYEDGKMIVYDLPTGRVIAKMNYGARIYAKISPDGNHVMMRDYKTPTNQVYYEIRDSSFVEISHEETNDALQRYLAFSPDNRLFLFYTGRVEIRDVQDYSLISAYDFPAGYVDGWDFDVNQVISYDYYTSSGYLMDINTGTILKTIKMEGSGFINLKSNYLTTGLGRKMNLDFLFELKFPVQESDNGFVPLPKQMLK